MEISRYFRQNLTGAETHGYRDERHLNAAAGSIPASTRPTCFRTLTVPCSCAAGTVKPSNLWLKRQALVLLTATSSWDDC